MREGIHPRPLLQHRPTPDSRFGGGHNPTPGATARVPSFPPARGTRGSPLGQARPGAAAGRDGQRKVRRGITEPCGPPGRRQLPEGAGARSAPADGHRWVGGRRAQRNWHRGPPNLWPHLSRQPPPPIPRGGRRASAPARAGAHEVGGGGCRAQARPLPTVTPGPAPKARAARRAACCRATPPCNPETPMHGPRASETPTHGPPKPQRPSHTAPEPQRPTHTAPPASGTPRHGPRASETPPSLRDPPARPPSLRDPHTWPPQASETFTHSPPHLRDLPQPQRLPCTTPEP